STLRESRFAIASSVDRVRYLRTVINRFVSSKGWARSRVQKNPYKSHKQFLVPLPLGYPRVKKRGVGIEPTSTTFTGFVCSCRGVRVVPLLTEHRLRANGHVAGVVPVDDVVAQLGFRHLQVAGQGALDFVVVRRRADIQVRLRNVEAAAVKA